MALLSPFQNKPSRKHVTYPESAFSARYKIIVSIDDSRYLEAQDWLTLNSSGSVDIKMFMVHYREGRWITCSIASQAVVRPFIAFENTDDALFFKIKFSV